MASNSVTNNFSSSVDLDKLLGYSGSIQLSPIDDALEEQQRALWDAKAIIESVALALRAHFDGDASTGLPEFHRALLSAARAIGDSADKLEAGTLEDRALAIARAKDSGSPL